MKRFLRAIAGLAIIALGLFAAQVLIGMKEERPVMSPPRAVKLVKTMPVQIQSESPITLVKGRAVSLDRIELYAEVSGVVLPTSKPFRTGTRFDKGEIMLRMDAGELELSLVAQRSAFLQLLTGALADLKVDYANAYEKWRSYTAELDVTQSLKPMPEFSGDQEKFFISNRGILNQYYTIRSSEERLAKFTLAAPFSGEVLMSAVNPGTLVRVGQKIGDLVSTSGFEIESAISREGLKVVQVGDSVALRADADGESIGGVVTRILRTIDPMTQTAKVFIRTDHPALRDGMYFTGEIYSKKVDGVMRIGRELLLPNDQLFAVEGDSMLRAFPAEVMVKSERDVLVANLPENRILLAEPVANAFDGMNVRVSEE